MSKITLVSSSAQFQKLLSANTYVIADFYADWCGPCKAIAPIYEQLATSHSQPGKLVFAKVNVDEQQEVAQKYGVSAMPTFLVFKKGTVSETIRGANPSALRTAVSRASSDTGKATASASFSSKGYTLGTDSAPGRAVGGGGGSFLGGLGQGGPGLADSMVRFMGLYLTTLFSFDAYAAAEASPFKVGTAQRR